MAGDDIGLCMEVIMLGKCWMEGSKWGATRRSMWKQDKVTRPSREIVCVAHQSWIQRKAEGGGGYNHWFCLHIWVVQTLRITFIIATFLTNRILDFELKYFIIISLHMRMCPIHIPTVTASSTHPAAWASQLPSSSSYSPVQAIVAPSWLSLHTNFT
jgi:hypothetical protein